MFAKLLAKATVTFLKQGAGRERWCSNAAEIKDFCTVKHEATSKMKTSVAGQMALES